MIEGNINEKLKGKRETNLDSAPFVVKQGDMDADCGTVCALQLELVGCAEREYNVLYRWSSG